MICLNMIVKNEAHCIARCLRSVRPYIDAAYICDTGSTDDTIEIIARELHGLPFHVDGIPWEGFGPSRTRALEEASRWVLGADAFLLFIDADETFEGAMPTPEELREFEVVQNRAIGPAGIWCYRNLLARASLTWEFTPITHETLVPVPRRAVRELDWRHGFTRQHDDSARRNSGAKAPEDVRLLEAWIAEHPNDSRAWFYLARSHQMVGDLSTGYEAYAAYTRALAAYTHRCGITGGDPQEVVVSRIFLGRIQTVGKDARALESYMLAYRGDPFRVEALCCLASNCIEAHDFVGAELAARQACALDDPPGRIFSEQVAYDWVRWDLLIQALIGLGGPSRLREAREIFFRLEAMPASEHERREAIREHLFT